MKITFDKKNYRKHSEQNKKRIRKSLTECGAGRSVLVDKDGCLIAGNGVYEQAQALKIPTRVIETDGTELVVVKRTDLAIDDQKRKRLALADNATSDHVEWDFENIDGEFDIETLADFGIVIEDETNVNPDDYGEEFELNSAEKDGFQQVSFMLTDKQAGVLKWALSALVYSDEFAQYDRDGNANDNGSGIAFLAEMWIGDALDNSDKAEEEYEEYREKVEELKDYLRASLKASGKTATYVDKQLGTKGMSGHYFGDSQWMFPTRDKYEQMREFMDLPRDHAECMRVICKFNYLQNLLKKIDQWDERKI